MTVNHSRRARTPEGSRPPPPSTFARWRYRVRGERVEPQVRESHRLRGDLPLPGRGVVFRFARAVEPDQPVTLGTRGSPARTGCSDPGARPLRRSRRRSASRVTWPRDSDSRKVASSPRVRGRMLRNRSPVLVEVGHVLGGGQLAIGHVEEVAGPSAGRAGPRWRGGSRRR